jgi:aspartyl protease family protein
VNNHGWVKVVIILALGFINHLVHADTQVNVVGLFNGKALVTINGGAPQTLSVGQTKSGVKLIAADSQQATLLIEGKTKVLGMGQGVSAGGAEESTQNQPVNLYADSAGHFFGSLSVNGATLKYVVDTGATTVALNSADAKRANIDYLKGEKSVASTAGGQVVAYRVTLNTLRIGSIVLNNVEAAVIEGGFPEVVLLGMTALNRMDMKRDNSTMTLIKKY